jgi:hypothetical protein
MYFRWFQDVQSRFERESSDKLHISIHVMLAREDMNLDGNIKKRDGCSDTSQSCRGAT